MSKMSEESKFTSCTKRKPHPVIKMATYIASKKYLEENDYFCKDTRLSAFQLLQPHKSVSISAKKIINFSDEVKKDNRIVNPTVMKNPMVIQYYLLVYIVL
jgi:hypothetical protein